MKLYIAKYVQLQKNKSDTSFGWRWNIFRMTELHVTDGLHDKVWQMNMLLSWKIGQLRDLT